MFLKVYYFNKIVLIYNYIMPGFNNVTICTGIEVLCIIFK